MSAGETSALAELTTLRRQLEALTQQVTALEQRLAAPGDSAAATRPEEEIPWLVITAAIAAVVKERHRIVSLQMPGLPPLNIWSIEGRRAVFHSHRLR